MKNDNMDEFHNYESIQIYKDDDEIRDDFLKELPDEMIDFYLSSLVPFSTTKRDGDTVACTFIVIGGRRVQSTNRIGLPVLVTREDVRIEQGRRKEASNDNP